MYQIKFTLGEKTGEIVPLTHNQTISIGRSHTNDICLKAAGCIRKTCNYPLRKRQ